MKHPLVTVIIPCFNYGQYIDTAVDSILAQSYSNVEIIIVDDGSTDLKTLKKLKNYNRPKTTVFFQQNLSPSGARNFGFSKSSGEYILTLDADDMFEQTFIKKSLKILKSDPSIGAVSSFVLQFGFEDSIWKPSGGSLVNFLLKINCHASALIRRKAWEQIDGFDENMKENYEDWDFWIRLTAAGWSVHIIPEELYFYRIKEDSRVNSLTNNHAKLYNVLRRKHRHIFADYFYLRMNETMDGLS